MKFKDLNKFVLCDPNDSPLDEIGDKNFFDSKEDCHEWIKEQDPDDECAWDIYEVKIEKVDML